MGRKEMMVFAAALSCLSWVLWLDATASSALVLDLITEEEAAAAKIRTRPFRRDAAAIGRGPSIDVRGPKKDDYTISPFELEIRFKAYGGAKIDPDSINIRYWSDPRRSLTARLKPFYKDNVIRVPAAKAPKGKHQVEISVNDSNGFGRTLIYDFQVNE
jgi:hypothetical protein